MKCILRQDSIVWNPKGRIHLEKGTVGRVKGVSNSTSIRENVQHLGKKLDEWFYLVDFSPKTGDTLCNVSQIDLT